MNMGIKSKLNDLLEDYILTILFKVTDNAVNFACVTCFIRPSPWNDHPIKIIVFPVGSTLVLDQEVQ